MIEVATNNRNQTIKAAVYRTHRLAGKTVWTWTSTAWGVRRSAKRAGVYRHG